MYYDTKHLHETDWYILLDSFGRELLRSLGVDSHDFECLSTNPIVEALRRDAQGFVAPWAGDNRFNLTSVSKVATICQMAVYDRIGGPEGDGQPKGLRRHWYAWYKTEFAQPFSIALGEDPQDPRWGLNWAGRLSTVYASFVDEMDVTYLDLWVKDASRMMSIFDVELYKQANIIVAVEKDSLFDDFIPAARAIGAKAIISGKGKNSKAATEKLLRDAQMYPGRRLWSERDYDYVTLDVIDYDHPLVIIHISDHDYDGEAVIGPTFGEQATRYADRVLTARVGIRPAQVREVGERLEDKVYQVKLSHNGYIEWAEQKAIFERECIFCGKHFLTSGSYGGNCTCGEPLPDVTVGKGKNDAPAYGLEVEALRTRDYYRFMVEALLSIVDFDDIVWNLRQETVADSYSAAYSVAQDVLEDNESYQRLLEEWQRLERIKREFEENVIEELAAVADNQIDAYDYLGDDPEEDDFTNHVVNARSGSYPWRPFDSYERTQALTEDLALEAEDFITALKEYEIEF